MGTSLGRCCYCLFLYHLSIVAVIVAVVIFADGSCNVVIFVVAVMVVMGVVILGEEECGVGVGECVKDESDCREGGRKDES